MAGAQKTPLPVVRQRCLTTRLKLVHRRAAQVRTNAYGNHNFGFDGAVVIAGVSRSQLFRLALGMRVGQLAFRLGQCRNLLRRTLDDPNGLAAPFNRQFFTWLEGGNVHLDRSAGRSGPL